MIIYSEISKLLFPVIASIPRILSKFFLSGKLSLPRAESSEFVTHGGFPTKRIFSFSEINSFIFGRERKKSLFKIEILFVRF